MNRVQRREIGAANRLAAAAGAARARGAFTLVELLVASAAVLIVTVGIAQVFQVTGATVASGRKLSSITTFAASLERQFRADFAAMTREGFLVIRNAGVDIDGNDNYEPGTITNPGPDAAPLYPGDPLPRARRSDELMFFAKGDFTTLRDPRHPERVARSKEARIYYGHGNRRASNQGFSVDPTAFASPIPLDDLETAQLGSGAGANIALGQFGPNQYASDWLLVRHVTLLAPPSGAEKDSLLLTGASVSSSLRSVPVQSWQDSDFQIALQPAAPSIFRRINSLRGTTANDNHPTRDEVARRVEAPRFSCGAVDIATTSLSEIRATILGSVRNYGPLDLTPQNFDAYLKAGLTPFPTDDPAAPLGVNYLQATRRMQAWMIDALPADSDGLTQPQSVDAYQRGHLPNNQRRIRAEPTAPNFLGLPTPQTQTDYDRSDQLMLAASVFVPRCSDFIVEWSFGEVEVLDANTQGRTLWYGMQRLVDAGQDGQVPPTGAGAPNTFVNYYVRPFMGQDPSTSQNLPANHPSFAQRRQTVTRRDGSKFSRAIPRLLISPDPYFDPQLRFNPLQADGPVAPMYSIFGYIDPTYTPARPPDLTRAQPTGRLPAIPEARPPRDGEIVDPASGWVLTYDADGNGRYNVTNGDPRDVVKPALLVDVNGNGQYDPADGDVLLEPDTVPCPWPTMIRITMSIADPLDPKIEKTFQFILPVPPPKQSETF